MHSSIRHRVLLALLSHAVQRRACQKPNQKTEKIKWRRIKTKSPQQLHTLRIESNIIVHEELEVPLNIGINSSEGTFATPQDNPGSLSSSSSFSMFLHSYLPLYSIYSLVEFHHPSRQVEYVFGDIYHESLDRHLPSLSQEVDSAQGRWGVCDKAAKKEVNTQWTYFIEGTRKTRVLLHSVYPRK